MTGICTYEGNILLNTMLGNGTPATVYLGLCTGVTAGGVISGEPSTNNYSRIAVTNNTTNFPNSTAASISNGTVITFATPSGTWGTLTTFFVSTAATTNTNTICYGTIPSITPGNGDTVKFAIGTLTVTLS